MNVLLVADQQEAVRGAPHGEASRDGVNRRLLFLLPYPLHTVPGQRLKFEQYFGIFEQAGYEIHVRCFFDEPFYQILYQPGRYLRKVLWTVRSYLRRFRDLRHAAAYDVVYVHLWVAPLGPSLYEWLLTRVRRPIIYDIDDLIFLRHASSANRFVKFLRGRGSVHYLMAHSDHIIVCTDYLKAYALRFNPHVTNISSTINTDVYVPRTRWPDSRSVCIGWSGSHTTVAYVALLQDVFEELSQRYDVYFKVIGHPQPPLHGLKLVAQDWRLETEVEDLQEIDIGVYPLPNDEWVLGKSGLKALQYMGLGIPTVATAIGATREIIRDGENGFLATSREEWVEKLARLIEDPALRDRIGANGRRTVEERYSVKGNATRYLEILSIVCRNAPPRPEESMRQAQPERVVTA